MDLAKSINRFNLTRRERLGVAVAGAAVFLFLFFHLGVFPLLDARHRMQRIVFSKTAVMQEMQNLRKEYRGLLDRSRTVEKRLNRRMKGFTLFSFLEDLAGQSGIKNQIVYMKPSVQSDKDSTHKISLIEMKLESISFKDLVDYLYNVETQDPLVIIRRLSIFKAGGLDGRIQAILQVETIET